MTEPAGIDHDGFIAAEIAPPLPPVQIADVHDVEKGTEMASKLNTEISTHTVGSASEGTQAHYQLFLGQSWDQITDMSNLLFRSAPPIVLIPLHGVTTCGVVNQILTGDRLTLHLRSECTVAGMRSIYRTWGRVATLRVVPTKSPYFCYSIPFQ